MANKRDLRKHINYACGDLADACIFTASIIKGADTAALDNIILKIAALQVRSLGRVNVAFDKTERDFDNKRQYHTARNRYYRAAYRSLLADFDSEIKELVKEMNSAMPRKA